MALDKSMISERSWEEFRESGLLLYINQILQPFGWSLVLSGNYDKNGKFKVSKGYPAHTRYRGFTEKNIAESYRKISKYLAANAVQLDKEAEEADW